MKRRALKVALSTGGAGLLLTTAIALPLVSCSNSDGESITINKYPQKLSSIKRQDFDKLLTTINNGPEFGNEDYIKANLFVFNSIRNALDNNQKNIINNSPVNQTNYVKNIGYSNDQKYLIIKTISNNKNYVFSFLRSHGDIFYSGNNTASITGFENNNWVNILSYNNSQFTQKYINNVYKELGLSLVINNGSLSPWLTNGFYDGINNQAIFTLYGYYDNQPFDFNSATPICNIAINTNGTHIISEVNPNIDASTLKIESIKGNLWKTQNDILNIIDVLNTLTNTSFDAVDGLLGNDQQLLNGIETNVSKLMQAIGNVNLNTKELGNNLIKLLENKVGKVDTAQIKAILTKIVGICKDKKTYAIYNQILDSVNKILNQNVYDKFIDLNKLNNSLETAILNNNHFILSDSFNGLLKIFNQFNLWSKSNSDIETRLWETFIKNEIDGWGLRLGSKIANDWLMISSADNIYFESNITTEKDIKGNPTKNISGSLYFKIINNTNSPKQLTFLNQKYDIPVDKAFNLYLKIDNSAFTPFVYADNAKFKFGLNIIGNENSFYNVGVFDKDAKNIENNSEFKKVTLSNFKLDGMTACGGQINNIQVNDIKPTEPVLNAATGTTTTNVNEQIKQSIINIYTNNINNAGDTIANLKTLTDAFSNESNTLLQALTLGAPAINKLLVSLLESIAGIGDGFGSSITNIISIVNLLNPNGTVPPILKTLNNLLPKLKNIFNYVPHLYKTLSDGTTVDMLGKFEPTTSKYLEPNKTTFLHMIGNFIEGLLKSYQLNTDGTLTTTPYAIWDLLNDHIVDLVGILTSITPIMNMIPDSITTNPITNNSQWEPSFANNKTSPLDSIVPVITTNFFNQDTGASISKDAMKGIVAGLDSIAPSIEGLLSNGGLIPPSALSSITNLIKGIAATASPDVNGSTNAQSLLSFVSQNGQVIIDILNTINPSIGGIVNAILTAFTGKTGEGFLNVTIKDLNGMDIPSEPATPAPAPSEPGSSTTAPVAPSNTDVGTKVIENFWTRLANNFTKINNNTLKTIANVMNTVGPILGGLLNSAANPINGDNNQTMTSNDFKKSINVTITNNPNPQINVNFSNDIKFDVTKLIEKIKPILNTIATGTIKTNGPYYITFTKNNPISYDLFGFNPSYSLNNNNYFVNGLSAHLNKKTDLSKIISFIDFSVLNKAITGPLIGNVISGISPILKTIIDILKINNSNPSNLIYLFINFLLPNFGSLLNIKLSDSSQINNSINEIDPFNFVLLDGKPIQNIDIPTLTIENIINKFKTYDLFGTSFWNNVTNNKAFLTKDNTDPTNNTYIYTSLVPLISIDKNGNKRQIKGIKIVFTNTNNVYSANLTPIFADTIFTNGLRNLMFSLFSSNIIDKSTVTNAEANTNNLVSLTPFGKSFIEFLDNKINSPITNAVLNDLKISSWKTPGVLSGPNVIININNTVNSLSASNTNVALANLVSTLENSGWNTIENQQNFNIIKSIANNSLYNKIITIKSITAIKNKQQDITLSIPNTIAPIFDNKQIINKAKPQATTNSIEIKIRIKYAGTAPTQTSLTVGNTIQTETTSLTGRSNPIDSANKLFNNLYSIATNPDGIALESKFGDVINDLYGLINSFMGYYPTINNLSNLMPTISSLLNQFIPQIIANANNTKWWANVQKTIGFLLKFIK